MHHNPKPLRFAIFASGKGSNARVLMQSFSSRFIPADLVCVLSNIAEAGVLQIAREQSYKTALLEHRGKTREQHEKELLALLHEHRVDHILLAGYMRILSPFFLQNWHGNILNIHPALLPDFPGLHAAEKQWESHRTVAGATVHFVDQGVDTGPILLQGSMLTNEGESFEVFMQRLQTEVEHVIYPRAVRLFIDRLATKEV